jgi:hypothetical protein
MVEEKRCEICGKATRKTLFKDHQTKVYICSRKCEYEYLETLHGKDKALQSFLHYLDKKIAKIKRYELYCWMITLLGIVMMLVSVFLANIPATKDQLVGPYLFLIGIIPLTSSLLFISQLYKEEEKLLEARERLSLAYSH